MDADTRPPASDDEPATSSTQASRADADELVEFAHELERGTRPRRRGMARKRGRSLSEDGAFPAGSTSQMATVRSDTDEQGAEDEDADGSSELLGADGEPIVGPPTAGRAGPASGAPVDAVASTRHDGVEAPGPSKAPAMAPSPAIAPGGQAAAFLALAVRTYLDGIDRFGPDSEVTLDRLARLRETLSVYDATG